MIVQAGTNKVWLILAHGAGGNMNSEHISALAQAFVEVGIGVVRFNFAYRDAGKSIPPPMPKLIPEYQAVIEVVRAEQNPEKLLIGGHSMGGRVASMLAANPHRGAAILPALDQPGRESENSRIGERARAAITPAKPETNSARLHRGPEIQSQDQPERRAENSRIGERGQDGRATGVDGLVLLSYPLHPPDKPDKLRVEHLPHIQIPTLCFEGTNDPFCTPEIMREVASSLSNFEIVWFEGADHSLHAPKSFGRSDRETRAQIAAKVASWAEGL